MLGELIPCGGGDPIPLLKSTLLIGRRSRCDICLRFPNVSSHHCRLDMINGYWCVRDLQSTNGIKVNGVRYDSKFLVPGDVLAIAKHRFELNYTPQSDAPPPDEEDPLEMGLLEKAGLTQIKPLDRTRDRNRSSRSRRNMPPDVPIPRDGTEEPDPASEQPNNNDLDFETWWTDAKQK